MNNVAIKQWVTTAAAFSTVINTIFWQAIGRLAR